MQLYKFLIVRGAVKRSITLCEDLLKDFIEQVFANLVFCQQGWLDQGMSFFFYLPNFIITEFIVRARQFNSSTGLRIAAALVLFLATAFLMIGIYLFTDRLWGLTMAGLFT